MKGLNASLLDQHPKFPDIAQNCRKMTFKADIRGWIRAAEWGRGPAADTQATATNPSQKRSFSPESKPNNHPTPGR